MEGKVSKAYTFTSGPLFGPLIKFAMPVLGALILQSLYGAVDLWVVGQYGVKADISAVSTGAQFIMMITNVIIRLAVGTSVLIGQNIGAGRRDLAGDILAAGIKLFAVCALLVMIIIPIAAPAICGILNSPEEAFPKAVSYMRICGLGGIFIVSYNLLSSLFKGMGDSKTPLMAVSIAAVLNIGGDIAFVKGLGMGASGAALATVISQGISVLICIFIIRKRGLPFEFSVDKLKSRQMHNIKRSVRLGAPHCASEPSGKHIVPGAHIHNKRHRSYGIVRTWSRGKTLRFHNAAAVRVRAVHVRCGVTEHRRRTQRQG